MNNNHLIVNDKTNIRLQKIGINDIYYKIGIHDDANIFEIKKYYWITHNYTRKLVHCFYSTNIEKINYVYLKIIDDYLITYLDNSIKYNDRVDGLTNANITEALYLINKFIIDRTQFTSIDISNRIKRTGFWIHNHRISKLMYSEYIQLIMDNNDYECVSIDVLNNDVQLKANLYKPKSADQNSYLDTAQHALTPDEVRSIVNKSSVSSDLTTKNSSKTRMVYYIVKK